MGFGIPWPVFRIPKAKISLIPESGFPYTVHGARFTKQNVSEIFSTLYLPLFPFLSLLLVCTWLHGGHVGGDWNKSISLLRELTPFSCKFFEKKLCCIDHQHSRVVTCLQTKNPFPFFLMASLPFKLKQNFNKILQYRLLAALIPAFSGHCDK